MRSAETIFCTTCSRLFHRAATTAVVAAAVLAGLEHRLAANEWPQFRGPNCSGVSQGKDPLPTRFSLVKNRAWSAELGDGIGSPVVADGRVFASAMTADRIVSLYCFNAATGEAVWQRDLPTGPLAEIHKTNSHAATTPAADAERVYFYFSTLGLMAFDAETGCDVWHVELPVPYFVFKWGPAMSPVLYEDMVLFCQDDDLHPALYAVDKVSGELQWRVERSEMAVNYSHPIVCRNESGPEIVVAGTGLLVGYDPCTGEELWHARTLLRNIKTTPVSHNGVVYISLQSGGIANQWLATADADSDGRLSKGEIQGFVGETKIPEAFWKKFERGDANRDGYLQGEELDLAFLDPDNFAGARWDEDDPVDQFVMAVRGGGRGDVTATHVLWKRSSRAPDHIVSPLVVENRMLVIKGGGIASCFDTADGKPIWRRKRIQNGGEYFASPVSGDGKIYMVGENGYVVVLADGPRLKVLAKNDVGESCLATPAIADGRIFIRTRNHLHCFATQDGAAPN